MTEQYQSKRTFLWSMLITFSVIAALLTARVFMMIADRKPTGSIAGAAIVPTVLVLLATCCIWEINDRSRR